MEADSFELVKKKADDKNIKEIQLTTDGEEHYSYARGLNEEEKKEFQKEEKDRKDYRVPAIRIAEDFILRDKISFSDTGGISLLALLLLPRKCNQVGCHVRRMSQFFQVPSNRNRLE